MQKIEEEVDDAGVPEGENRANGVSALPSSRTEKSGEHGITTQATGLYTANN
jgi:hypothetical protein